MRQPQTRLQNLHDELRRRKSQVEHLANQIHNLETCESSPQVVEYLRRARHRHTVHTKACIRIQKRIDEEEAR